MEPVAKSSKSSVSREESMQKTRAALIDAALDLFAKEGLDTPSLDAICDRAGFTRGAFYVHFPDRDALLVAVMEKVGESFLASVFSAGGDASLPVGLIDASNRFLRAIADGTYPLMSTSSKKSTQIRPHQLLDACARSKVVRERYKALVEASIEQVKFLAATDQEAGRLRKDVNVSELGTLFLSTIVGAQTLVELGIAIDPAALAKTVFAMLRLNADDK